MRFRLLIAEDCRFRLQIAIALHHIRFNLINLQFNLQSRNLTICNV